ncbi:hypothetical protein J3D55_002318 [Chryseobacterium ginsenosidimutans]|uniref:phage integrase SAM-like domain-containing protein n=1 Tax=Chryseobacterium ginsenosidimutans TaxID=687846 RepID=UPI002169614D|nr:phage integrase SAM-like domain-containing protein [Chryseobacterium ginsenosidimutans]MCS3869402.1 hypothetical protein [Chryseobacterium ginsenosidimutans]
MDVKIAEGFKTFLLSSAKSNEKKNVISRNTASTYFPIFKAFLKQAFIDDNITSDLSAKIKEFLNSS